MRAALPIVALAAALGCTADGPPARIPDCVESQVSACLCDGARQGWQTCRVDRTWGECLCADGGAMTTPPPACEEPFARCAGECVNLLVTAAHCGRCGASCGAGQLCVSGNCALLDDGARPAVDAVSSDIPLSEDAIADTPSPDDVPADGAVDAPGDAPPPDDIVDGGVDGG